MATELLNLVVHVTVGAGLLVPRLLLMMSASQLDLVEEAVDMLRAVVPEEDDLALGDFLAALDGQANDVVEMAKELGMEDGTYLLFCATFLGLRSTFLNQAK